MFLAAIGAVAFIGYLVWLIIRIRNYDSKIPPIIGMLLCVVMIVGGISLEPGEKTSKSNSGDENTPPVQEDNAASDSNPEEDTTVQNDVSSGKLGDYQVEIKSASLASDYEGKPAIVITYSWTNNSDETISSLAAVHAKVFQDGVQLENAIIANKDVYDSSSYTKDVRPGTTIDIQNAFILTSETSTVEVEITELISFSDEKVTMSFDPASLS